ncbi:hypothetical protein BC938DRAFT_477970, partial [Jimgerdemannia flammicorona]
MYKNALNDFVVFDTKTWVYTVKSSITGGSALTPRSGASAVLVNNSLVVFVGEPGYWGELLSNLFVVDTTAWAVLPTFTPAGYLAPTSASKATPSSSSFTGGTISGSSGFSIGAIIGIVIGVVLVIAAVGFLLYRRSKCQQLPTVAPVLKPSSHPHADQHPSIPPNGFALGTQIQYYDTAAALVSPLKSESAPLDFHAGTYYGTQANFQQQYADASGAYYPVSPVPSSAGLQTTEANKVPSGFPDARPPSYLPTYLPTRPDGIEGTATGVLSNPTVSVSSGSDTPFLRRLHTANLAADGHTIIIFGGDTPIPTTS